MRIIGCDLHARQQTLAMSDTETGEVVSVTLQPAWLRPVRWRKHSLTLVDKMTAWLSAASICDYSNIVKAVVASALDEMTDRARTP
jgi:hypothetical protein